MIETQLPSVASFRVTGVMQKHPNCTPVVPRSLEHGVSCAGLLALLVAQQVA